MREIMGECVFLEIHAGACGVGVAIYIRSLRLRYFLLRLDLTRFEFH